MIKKIKFFPGNLRRARGYAASEASNILEVTVITATIILFKKFCCKLNSVQVITKFLREGFGGIRQKS